MHKAESKVVRGWDLYPSLPFCDVDGTIAGAPNTCIAVSCSAGQFEECRGDDALTCNAQGTSFDVTQCPLGCGINGCNGCASNDQCTGATPVCETSTGECRACVVDDDCASKVCDIDTGMCVAESSVAYASSGGAPGPCSLASPCSLTDAVAAASGNPLRSTLRMLPGSYTTSATFSHTNVTVVGTGATMQVETGTDGFEVLDGGQVKVRGLAFDMSREVRCDSAPSNQNTASLELRDVSLRTSDTLILSQCNASIKHSTITATGSGISLLKNTDADIDQTRFIAGTPGIGNPDPFNATTLSGQHLDIKIVNSLFEDVFLLFNPQDTTQPSRIVIAFSTFSLSGGLGGTLVTCNNSSGANVTKIVENNVIRSIGADAISAACNPTTSVLIPEVAVVSASNIKADPMFVSVANHDFHLQATSPARDAALPSTGLDPAVDLDGTARPQGTKKDIGAFEFK